MLRMQLSRQLFRSAGHIRVPDGGGRVVSRGSHVFAVPVTLDVPRGGTTGKLLVTVGCLEHSISQNRDKPMASDA